MATSQGVAAAQGMAWLPSLPVGWANCGSPDDPPRGSVHGGSEVENPHGCAAPTTNDLAVVRQAGAVAPLEATPSVAHHPAAVEEGWPWPWLTLR